VIITDDVHYAGFWRRAGAALIDFMLWTLTISILLGPRYADNDFVSSAGLLGDSAALILIVFLWVNFMGTPGKLLLNCQVVDATSGRHVSYRQAIIRALGYYVSALPFFLGFFWIIWDKRKQGFHDKLANTVVIQNAHLQRDDLSQASLQQLMREAGV
jgi:uncharacterized RDD family membrane protein YckC